MTEIDGLSWEDANRLWVAMEFLIRKHIRLMEQLAVDLKQIEQKALERPIGDPQRGPEAEL